MDEYTSKNCGIVEHFDPFSIQVNAVVNLPKIILHDIFNFVWFSQNTESNETFLSYSLYHVRTDLQKTSCLTEIPKVRMTTY